MKHKRLLILLPLLSIPIISGCGMISEVDNTPKDEDMCLSNT